MAILDVPNFMDGLNDDDGEIFNQRQETWLRQQGLDCIVFPIAGELSDVLKCCEAWNPGKLFLLGGEAVKGVGHTVIANANGIVHDPHPRNIGITRPMSDGMYWITYITGRNIKSEHQRQT